MHKYVIKGLLVVIMFLLAGMGIAFSAPGDYSPDMTSDKYTAPLTDQDGVFDTDLYGIENGLDNANQTGLYSDINDGLSAADVIKSVYGQRVHGQYTKDTNSCASCHETHTASGAKLLFKNGSYNTCVACHDGTMGFYDVLATGHNASTAGTFGGNPDKALSNSSVHFATGVMKISAAPGGDRDNTDPATWGKEFTCTSCHSPHGSYSGRLLSYNPNGVGTTPAMDENGSPTGGRFMQNVAVVFDPTVAGGVYTAQDSMGSRVPGPWVFGYPYGVEPRQFWSQIRVMRPGETTFSPLYDSEFTWNEVLDVNYFLGCFKDPAGLIPAGSLIQMDIAPASVVELQTATTTYAPNGIPITTVIGYLSGVNRFCSACHTDYYTTEPQVSTEVYYDVYYDVYNSRNIRIPTGVFSEVYRHSIAEVPVQNGLIGESGKLMCITCHYAHGTEKSVMLNVYDELGLILDISSSSALKRYANQEVCYKCHTDSKEGIAVHNL